MSWRWQSGWVMWAVSMAGTVVGQLLPHARQCSLPGLDTAQYARGEGREGAKLRGQTRLPREAP